jgi:hypothetical protein
MTEHEALGVMTWKDLAALAWQRAVYSRIVATITGYKEVVLQSGNSPTTVLRVSFADGDARFEGVVAEDRFEGCGVGAEVLMCVEARSGDDGPLIYVGAIAPISTVSAEDILNNRGFRPRRAEAEVPARITEAHTVKLKLIVKLRLFFS